MVAVTGIAFSDWSELTSLLSSRGALCEYESQRETGAIGSLPYVRVQAGREM